MKDPKNPESVKNVYKNKLFMIENIKNNFSSENQEKKSSLEAIKEKAALKLAEEIEERMKQEGKTVEGYERITELVKTIEKIYEEKIEDLRILWDWETGEKFLVDWERDYKERFKRCSDPQFSPDGGRVAAKIEDERGHSVAVDGQAWKKRFENCGYPQFSPDGGRIAASIRDEKGWSVAIDGQSWKERFGNCGYPKFSPDGGRIAASIRDEKGWSVIVDGQSWKERFKTCGYPQFSPDGGRVAAQIEDKKGWSVAVDGQVWKERFKECGDPQFSLDGTKIMVVVKKEGKYYRLVREV